MDDKTIGNTIRTGQLPNVRGRELILNSSPVSWSLSLIIGAESSSFFRRSRALSALIACLEPPF